MSDTLLMPTSTRAVALRCPECLKCNTSSHLFISTEEWERLKSGEFVHDVFPDISLEERELIIFGVHDDCWDEMFQEAEAE